MIRQLRGESLMIRQLRGLNQGDVSHEPLRDFMLQISEARDLDHCLRLKSLILIRVMSHCQSEYYELRVRAVAQGLTLRRDIVGVRSRSAYQCQCRH
jgi:hypothetical protein